MTVGKLIKILKKYDKKDKVYIALNKSEDEYSFDDAYFYENKEYNWITIYIKE